MRLHQPLLIFSVVVHLASICSRIKLRVLRASNQITMYENSDFPLSFNGFWLLNRKTWTVDVERAEMWCVEAEDVAEPVLA